jgi:hypothetical protein
MPPLQGGITDDSEAAELGLRYDCASPDNAMTDFFISYTAADRPWAEWIASILEAAGFSVVIQAWDFRPGGNFVVEMQKATTGSERTIAVLSPDYLRSLYGMAEWAAAFAADPDGAKGKLVPVKVREVALEGLLTTIIHVNLVGLGEAAAREALLRGLVPGRIRPESIRFPGAHLFPGRREPPLSDSETAITKKSSDSGGHLLGGYSRLDSVQTSGKQKKLVNVFCSYSHRDLSLWEELKAHLSPLERAELIEVWSDQLIEAGQSWEEAIYTHLNSADIVLLLVSAYFFASDFSYSKEFKIALERHAAGKTRIIPIRARPVLLLNTPLNEIQALPLGGKPITSFPDPHVGWEEVTTQLHKILIGMKKAKALE